MARDFIKKFLSIIINIAISFAVWLVTTLIFIFISNKVSISPITCLLVPFILAVSSFYIRKKPMHMKSWLCVAGLCIVLILMGILQPTSEETSISITSTDNKSFVDTQPTTDNETLYITQPEETTQPEVENIPETTVYAPTEKDLFLESFCISSGYTQETAERIYKLLNDELQCTNIEFRKKHQTGEYSYDIYADGYLLVVTADNDGIYGISCGTYLLYENEQVFYTITDLQNRDVSGYEITYYMIATSIVEDNLIAPSTAEFAPIYKCNMWRNGSIAAVQGYVDSQNSFGAMIRSDFLVEFMLLDTDAFSYEIIYLRIGDAEAGEFIDLS